MNNSVTLEYIESLITDEEVLVSKNKKKTFVVLTTTNGFAVDGSSGVVDPENFDLEIGTKIARKRAIDKLFLVEGYLLQQKLYNESSTNSK